MYLARPYADLHGYFGGDQFARGELRVMEQDLGTGYVDECTGQPGLDVVERFLDLLGTAADGAALGGPGDQLRECG
jgi:hypothetical protein